MYVFFSKNLKLIKKRLVGSSSHRILEWSFGRRPRVGGYGAGSRTSCRRSQRGKGACCGALGCPHECVVSLGSQCLSQRLLFISWITTLYLDKGFAISVLL